MLFNKGKTILVRIKKVVSLQSEILRADVA